MAIERARYQRLQELQMWSILREIFIYICFLSLLCAITYSSRNDQTFGQVDHLRKYLLSPKQEDLGYSKVRLFSIREREREFLLHLTII